MTLIDLVLDVDRCLTGAGVGHAFGGALALAYVAEPRGTVDVDVNVFAPLDDVDEVLDVLAALALRPEKDRDDWVPVGRRRRK